MKLSSPIFLVGMPRSGTKLLRGLLNQHPLIEISNVETHFLPFWEKHWKKYGDLSDKNNFLQFYDQVTTKNPYFIYMREKGGMIEENNWYQCCENFKISGVFEALMRHDTNTLVGSEKIWGDKTPSYLIHISLIKGHFPSAKIIHIVRDVRDYSLSMNVAWGKNIIRSTSRWVEEISVFRKNLEDYGNDILELRYEDLLDNPEKQLVRICNFINLEFDKGMLQLTVPCEQLGDTQKDIAIVKSNKKKFLSKMTSKECELLESIARPILEIYDYPVEYKGKIKRINKVQMLLYKIIDGINLFRYGLEKRGIMRGIKFQCMKWLY
ncbi:MAG: sulfotransferase [Candidatus Lokiarchaeia archaeon]